MNDAANLRQPASAREMGLIDLSDGLEREPADDPVYCGDCSREHKEAVDSELHCGRGPNE